MRYINILLSEAEHLCVEKSQLKISKDGGFAIFPLEDINAVVIENQRLLLSSYTLSALAEKGIACFICGTNHIPNGILLPFNTHYKKLEVLNLQHGCPKPIQKRIWQSLVRQKIQNQAECLKLMRKDGGAEVEDLVAKVQSGDSSNIEAVAARKYFKYLFGNNFSREQDTFENAALNYTYSLVRGAIARTLCAYGFEVALGINHHNLLNAFNLTDDLIEPFRPICDLLIQNLEKKEKLGKEEKQMLLQIFQTSCLVDGMTMTLSYSIEMLVKSLKKSIEQHDIVLKLPNILKVGIKRYE